jgi:vancomycin resistance protein YoaR
VAVPGADGQQLDLSTAADALEQQVLIQDGPATLPPQPVHALGQDDAGTLNIRELVLDASLPIGGVDQWTRANTDRALADLHGRLVLPGQTFSLLDALGSLNEGRGYRSAPDDASVIARGVNLVASSLAQVVFLTGYGIEERQAPAHWTVRAGEPPRGQPGLDAAVDAAENRDFRFTNNTQQPLLIQSYIYGDNAIVALYGARPTWTVQVLEPVITATTPPDDEPERLEDPSAPMGQEAWIEDRSDGFSVSLQRSVIASGETSPRTLNLTSRYAPARGRILVGTKPSE